MRVAAEDTPVPFSPQMESYTLPSEDEIVKAVKAILG
jgi:pyruvate/2-oxoglutarate/acetoin dehydrogenase E1 component